MNHSQQQHMWDSDKSVPTPKQVYQHSQQYPWELPNSNNNTKRIDKANLHSKLLQRFIN